MYAHREACHQTKHKEDNIPTEGRGIRNRRNEKATHWAYRHKERELWRNGDGSTSGT